jgi:hypothetical protein
LVEDDEEEDDQSERSQDSYFFCSKAKAMEMLATKCKNDNCQLPCEVEMSTKGMSDHLVIRL